MQSVIKQTNSTGAKRVRLRTLKFLSLSAFAVGVASQPLAMILVGVFAPSLIHGTAMGKMDPISDSFFWVTVLCPSLGVLLWTAYAAVNGKLGQDSEPRIGVMAMKILLGILVAAVLIPVSFLWALGLTTLMRG